MRSIFRGLMPKALVMMAVLWGGLLMKPLHAEAMDESPYITFSPDGKAFTTNAGDREVEWYDYGTYVDTGMESALRSLEKGEHYYRVAQNGELAVGSWRVEYRTGTCCHQNYPAEGVTYHDITYGRQPCKAAYYSGWISYCADCGDTLFPYYVYMSREAAVSIKTLDTTLDYYYLCPFCSNLEQGVGMGVHWCRDISWNRYQIQYEKNCSEDVSGYMENSTHMYNNATVYEGREVTPCQKLSKNTYVRVGYEFKGWNTEPDGSGMSFEDQEQILNLTDENYDESGNGIVVLYAQWKKANSTLRIDPAGGRYKGKYEVSEIVGEYGASYTLERGEVIPPEGALVTFQTNGGKEVEAIRGAKLLIEWQPEQPFLGRLQEDTYLFTAEPGSVDTIKAVYDRATVTLPLAEKDGSSFGGWYYDEDCLLAAGREGDRIVPQQDMTLYAKWVDLVLYADNNTSANNGKGAVDLSWVQNDGQSKVYRIYQSTDCRNWNLVSGAEDISNSVRVDRNFSFSGMEQVYVVPYTGLYTLKACGAKGGDCGEYFGGYGGSVTGQAWLEKNERLSYIIGGQNGYNGGGKGTIFADGGGCTIVRSDLKGDLIIAGGGGGATAVSNGSAGGSVAGNISTGINGENGEAGGGGGYQGGTAGQVLYHYHSDKCYRQSDTSYTVMSFPDYLGSWAQEQSLRNYCYECFGSYYGMSKNIWNSVAHGKNLEEAGVNLYIGDYIAEDGSRKYALIPTEGNSVLDIHVTSDTTGGSGILCAGEIKIWDQNDKLIFSKSFDDLIRYGEIYYRNQDEINAFLDMFEDVTGGKKGDSSGWYCYYSSVDYSDHSAVYWNERVSLPDGTTGVRILVNSTLGNNEVWFGTTIQEISFSGSEQIKVCAYEEGQAVSDVPAYGGSNYVNTQYMTDYRQEAGKNEGEGSFAIQSLQTGYRDELFLKGVKAQDRKPPARVEEEAIQKNATDESKLRLSWKEPKDEGTDYYHRAESYLHGCSDVLSHSNVTKNTIVSGVAGYYWLVDDYNLTEVDNENGCFAANPSIEIMLTQDRQYFHVAAVDRAGNIASTTHIEIGKADDEVAWPVWTEALHVNSTAGSVYCAGEDTYYVKCDGKTPFRLDFTGFLVGQATPEYQINHLMYRMQEEGKPPVTMDIYTPGSVTVHDGVIITDASGVTKTATGSGCLKDDSYTITRRSDHCRRLAIEQRFTMEPFMDGKSAWIVPVAGADFGNQMITSDWERDKNHGLWLIGDSTPPAITGTEAMERFVKQGQTDGKSSFTFEVSDTGSGVKEFYMTVINSDIATRKKYIGTDKKLIVNIAEDAELFRGDFTVEFYAADHVGNEIVINCVSEGLELIAYAERILEPHNPVFRGGESGCLYITAYGYPDRIEVTFPEEMTALDPQLNTAFEYDGMVDRQEEQYLFTVPLRAPAGEVKITVRERKGDVVVTEYPTIILLGGEETVLNDIRTRLR